LTSNSRTNRPAIVKRHSRRRFLLGLLFAVAVVGCIAAFSHDVSSLGRVFKPAHDLGNWVSESFHDRGQNHRLEERARALRGEVVGGEVAEAENPELKALLTFDHSGVVPPEARPVTGEVIELSLSDPYVSVTVDVGTERGVGVGDPVVNGSGIVGKVISVKAHSAQVKLITASHMAIAATVVGVGVHGLVEASSVNPGHLSLDFIHPEQLLHKGQKVVTAGSQGDGLASTFPTGLPIGSVAGGTIKEQEASSRRPIRPYANLTELVFVQVLTEIQ
jgi:rod shape-determining protein MreC